jgi:signal transduction histidine kinase
MDLASFIVSHRDAILGEWEKDAQRRLSGGDRTSIAQLRDHLGELLDTIAHDLRDAGAGAELQTPAAETAAPPNREVGAITEENGAKRATQAMTLSQVMSEFPILRSCIARLWLRSPSNPSMADFETLIRIDESIDRALARSATEFIDRIDRTRATFLGILSHDLRDPLTTVISDGQLLLEGRVETRVADEVVRRIVDTAERMRQLVADLLDAIYTQRGKIPIERRDADLGQTVRRIAEEFTAAHPEREVKLNLVGDSRGRWDDMRIGQAVASLLTNAFRYGARDAPIGLSVVADREVTIAVHNEGSPVPESQREALLESDGSFGGEFSLDHQRSGLGLYLARAIVKGHGGSIELDSARDRGTTFSIHLPRR